MNGVEQNGVENNDDNVNENRRENLAKIEEELIELTSKITNPGILSIISSIKLFRLSLKILLTT